MKQDGTTNNMVAPAHEEPKVERDLRGALVGALHADAQLDAAQRAYENAMTRMKDAQQAREEAWAHFEGLIQDYQTERRQNERAA